jgi:hypothetical protein
MEENHVVIEPGKRYVVETDGVRFEVTAQRTSAVKGLWFCTTAAGGEEIVPESAFLFEVRD